MISTRETVQDPRPQDNPPVGGVKDTANSMYNIIPFVNETVSSKSPEDMRYSVESQFKQLADVTRSLVIKFNSVDAKLTGLDETIVSIKSMLSSLDARVTKLEEGGGTPP